MSEWDRVQSRKLWNVNWCDNRVQLNGIGIQIGISLSQWLLLLINQLQWESVKAAYKHTAYFAKSNIKGRNDALIWHSLLIINIQLTPLHKDLLLPPSTLSFVRKNFYVNKKIFEILEKCSRWEIWSVCVFLFEVFKKTCNEKSCGKLLFLCTASQA